MMKFFGLMIFLILAALMTSVVAYSDVDPAVEACKVECFKQPEETVCGTGEATFYNRCVMRCEKAELIHPGPCHYKDLMNNHGISN